MVRRDCLWERVERAGGAELLAGSLQIQRQLQSGEWGKAVNYEAKAPSEKRLNGTFL